MATAMPSKHSATNPVLKTLQRAGFTGFLMAAESSKSGRLPCRLGETQTKTQKTQFQHGSTAARQHGSTAARQHGSTAKL